MKERDERNEPWTKSLLYEQTVEGAEIPFHALKISAHLVVTTEVGIWKSKQKNDGKWSNIFRVIYEKNQYASEVIWVLDIIHI